MLRLAELRIRGLRTLADVTLSLGGVTVLIGDNGAGKSSILEALRIARLAAEPNFIKAVSREHMLGSALRRDVDGLRLDVRIESDAENLVYSLTTDATASQVTHEAIHLLPVGVRIDEGSRREDSNAIATRLGDVLRVAGREDTLSAPPVYSMLEFIGRGHVESDKIRRVLEGIDTHLPFEVGASWAGRSLGRASPMREPRVVEPAQRLELFGSNLANVYQALRNSGSARWQETLELLQLGLGPQLQDVQLPAIAGGHVSLSLELRGLGSIPAFQLADGQLAYLAFVGLVQLDPGRTLLSFDEPEQHLHPALLGRVMQLLERAGTHYPVVLATHSDRLLDLLPDPCASVRICELGAGYRTRLLELDRKQLDKWLTRYRGLGDVRAAGQLRSITADEDSAA